MINKLNKIKDLTEGAYNLLQEHKKEFEMTPEEIKSRIIEINDLLYKRYYDKLEVKVRELNMMFDLLEKSNNDVPFNSI